MSACEVINVLKFAIVPGAALPYSPMTMRPSASGSVQRIVLSPRVRFCRTASGHNPKSRYTRSVTVSKFGGMTDSSSSACDVWGNDRRGRVATAAATAERRERKGCDASSFPCCWCARHDVLFLCLN